mgnify:CR=1 FL=1
MTNHTNDLSEMFPGREVKIETAKGPITVTVQAIALSDVRKYADLISQCVGEIAAIAAKIEGAVSRATYATIAVPVVTKHLLDLVASCVSGIDITDRRVPHYVLPPIVAAWIEECFGDEKKVRPWFDLIRSATAKMGADPAGLDGAWDTVSRFFSPAVTPAPTSSPTDSPSSGTGSGSPPK